MQNPCLRYSRQIAVPEIGIEGQKKISGSKVMIIGAGALGSMVAMQLAGAGVGMIGIADYDTVDVSNLQRQFFFTTSEAGMYKAKVLANKIKELNPDIEVLYYRELITEKTFNEKFSEFDIIVDATDNPESKKMVGKVSQILYKPCVIGGVKNFSGQVQTFLPSDERFEAYFGEASGDGFLPCSLGGVMGPAAALCASVLADEVLKIITGVGEPLSGRVLVFDLLRNYFKVIFT